MTHDPNATAMQRYHDRFDNSRYTAIAEFVASNLNTDRDDELVVALLINVQNAALELCDHSRHGGASHILAVYAGRQFLSFYTIDAIRDFLHLFAPDDMRIEDFESTAKAMLRAYMGLDDLKTATAHANGVHSWQGRAAYHLLVACDFLTLAAIQLLAHGDASYIREKLKHGVERIASAIYEGVRYTDQPAMFDLTSTHFPSNEDHRG